MRKNESSWQRAQTTDRLQAQLMGYSLARGTLHVPTHLCHSPERKSD